MGVLCAVFGCGNNASRDKAKSFFRIPKIIRNNDPEKRDENLSRERRKKWLLNISRVDLTEEKAEFTRVCSDHFITGKPASLYDRNNPDWAPTQRMGHNKIKTPKQADLSRSERSQERAAKKVKIEAERRIKAAEKLLEETKEVPVCSENENGTETTRDGATHADVGCQTDLSGLQICEMEDCIKNMTDELVELKKKLMEADFNEESFKASEEKTKFYTGIPNFLILPQILSICSPYIYSGSSNILTKIQELILVLMRLRLNVPFQDLAYRFGVSRSTSTRIFDKWIDVLCVRLKFLVVWPDREDLIEAMPTVFKQNFGNQVAVIIDCFEVFVNRPSSLLARAITWSNYKHHNTVKFLIGITPQGVISFISKAWGGRASDKHITENRGILENFLPGDIVLADRGFDIADSVGLFQASLKIPAFTRGKSQLSAKDVEETRRIANVWARSETCGPDRKKVQLYLLYPIKSYYYYYQMCESMLNVLLALFDGSILFCRAFSQLSL